MTQEEFDEVYEKELKDCEGTSLEVEMEHHKELFMQGMKASIEFLKTPSK